MDSWFIGIAKPSALGRVKLTGMFREGQEIRHLLVRYSIEWELVFFSFFGGGVCRASFQKKKDSPFSWGGAEGGRNKLPWQQSSLPIRGAPLPAYCLAEPHFRDALLLVVGGLHGVEAAGDTA